MNNSKKVFLLYLIITKNNFKVSINDLKGKMVFKKTQGMLKGIRRGSINSADTSLIMMNSLSVDICNLGIKGLGIYIKGSTRWKKLSLRRLFSKLKLTGIVVKFVRDLTGVPHNGCTFPSKRRKRRRRRMKKKFFLKDLFKLKKAYSTKKGYLINFKIEKKCRKRIKKGLKFLKYIKKIDRKTQSSKLVNRGKIS